MGVLCSHNFFRSSSNKDLPASGSTLWSQVDDPVCSFHHMHVVFDDDDCVPKIDQSMEDIQQNPDILEMQSRGWFIEDIERLSRSTLR